MDADDERNFRNFVAARGPALMRLGYLLTGGDQHAAEDLVQSALSKAVPRWSRIDAPESYIRQAMYRQQISWWRRPAQRREAAHAELPERAGPDATDAVDLRLALREALATLTPRQRAVLVLRYLEERARRRGGARRDCRHRAQHGAPLPGAAAPHRSRPGRAHAHRGGLAMTDTQLLTDTLHDWSQEVFVPHDLADRALAGRRTARRRRAVPLLAGVATATVVVVGLAAAGTWGPLDGSGGMRHTGPAGPAQLRVSSDTEHQPPQTLVAAGAVAVSAIVTTRRDPVGTDGWETLRRAYSLLDPTSGKYEPTDWSYVAVAPGLQRAAVLKGDLPAAKVGILDLASGKVTRWIRTDHPVASVAWAPDGSRVLATAYDGDPDLQKPQGKDSFVIGDATRTGFVLVDPEEATATFTALPHTNAFGGRSDVGWTPDGKGVWSPSSAPDELFFNLDGRPVAGDRADLNSNLGIEAGLLPITSPDGRFRITRDSGLPTEITDTRSGETYRQRALQLLGWADDEHVVTLAGCSDPCLGTDEFKNGLVLMRYDGTDPVPLTATRKGEDGDWGFQLTPR